METNVPCQKACPAGTDIPAYLTAIAEGDPKEAYRINLNDNIFPAVLGRVCSRPCEAACRHGYEGLGDPVAICFSKRSAADFKTRGRILLDPIFPPSGKKVAVVGSGVAGLAVARNLTLFGHRVTIYEKHSRPGGMLNQGIPEFRLPRDVIEQEIAQITGLGVDIACNTTIGSDVLLSELLEQFDTVVMAAGALKPNLLNL
ncbi:MAG TPA: FAD-dependent oxidoreductase, partial [Pontiella sp.]|nr:FAD-dependent oxidoreductase [Pontiella sp.]